MHWTIMLIVLWLTNGLPEPHTVMIPHEVECQSAMANDMWNVLVKDRTDVSTDFAWNCQNADAPPPKPASEQGTPSLPPVSHKAQGDEA